MSILQRILNKQFHLFKGDWNPIDGGTPANKPVIGDVLFGPAAPLIPGTVQNDTLKGAGLLPGGGGASAGGAAGPNYAAQAEAAIRAAEIAAGASRDVAQTQLDIAREQAAAGVKSSSMTAIGAIIGAAMGANQTTEQIKQIMPHEAGAMTIKSWELAQKWNTTLQMKQAGYQDVAINYALSGKDGRALFRDPQWNAMKMAEDLKKDTLANINMFGIKSASNPHGVEMSSEDFIELMSFKDPKSIMSVDPQVAKERNAAFGAWEAQMRKDGLGLVVDIYKNPQLSGSSLLAMKGKDPLIDPALAPLLQMITGGGGSVPTSIPAGTGTGPKNIPGLVNYANPSIPGSKGVNPGGIYSNPTTKGQKAANLMGQAMGSSITNIGANGLPIVGNTNSANMTAWKQAMGNGAGNDIIGQALSNPVSPSMGGGTDTAMMNQVWQAAMQGEQNPKTAEIKKLMQMGLIDRYGMINAGVLMSMIPPELTAPPEFSVNRDISPQEKNMLMDQYNGFASMKVDPKLIKTESLGQGVTRKTLMNADGKTIAGSMMEGYMTNAMGESIYVSMQGTRLQNWYDKMSMINGLGPLFPGIMAPVTDSELNGTFEPGFWDAARSTQPKYNTSTINNQIDSFTSGLKQSKQGNLGAPKPVGYSGAPLAAGGR